MLRYYWCLRVYTGAESKQQTVEATQAGKQRVLRMAQDEEAHTLANFAGSIELETRERDRVPYATEYSKRTACTDQSTYTRSVCVLTIQAAELLQRTARGHQGRKAGRRWRRRRKELMALNALAIAAALAIQRTFRGYRGRNRACAIRASVTRWMAAVADEEAADYVADFKARERKQKNKFALIGSGIPDDDDDSSFGSLDMRDFHSRVAAACRSKSNSCPHDHTQKISALVKCPTVTRTRKYYLLLHRTATAGAHSGTGSRRPCVKIRSAPCTTELVVNTISMDAAFVGHRAS
eukprot:5429-Heterococcus_DN1.PRE.3